MCIFSDLPVILKGPYMQRIELNVFVRPLPSPKQNLFCKNAFSLGKNQLHTEFRIASWLAGISVDGTAKRGG